MRSLTPLASPWNELVSGLSLFSGTVDDFLSMNASTRQLWRAPTPNFTSNQSPLLNHVQPTYTSAPSSNGIICSPNLTITELASTPGFQLQLPTFSTFQGNEQTSRGSFFSMSLGEFDLRGAQPTDDALTESIFRLMQHANGKENRVESLEPAILLNDMQALLRFAQRADSLPSPCQYCGNVTEPSVWEELKLADSLLLAAQSVAINCNGEAHYST